MFGCPRHPVAPAAPATELGRSASKNFGPRASEVGMTKPTNRKIKSDEVPDDIRLRVIKDFGPELADDIYRYLLDRIPDGLPNGTRPRHLRCILYLAKGDRTLLDRYIEMCLQDTRDVMLNAEYATDANARGRFVRVRDFGKPFDRSPIRGRKRGGADKGTS